MVYTRSQNTPVLTAAQGLLSMRNSTVKVTRYTAKDLPLQDTILPGKFWAQWTNWYHAFLAEIKDEAPQLSIAERRSQATSRWVTFTAKELRCSESDVRAWLRNADQKDLVAAYA